MVSFDQIDRPVSTEIEEILATTVVSVFVIITVRLERLHTTHHQITHHISLLLAPMRATSLNLLTKTSRKTASPLANHKISGVK